MIENMKNMVSNLSKRKKYVLSAVGVCLIGTGATYGGYEGTKDTVRVTIDGKTEEVRTHADQVSDLLKELDIKLQANDYISHAKHRDIQDNMNIVIKYAKPVQLIVDNERRKIFTTADTVEDVLRQQKISITEKDEVLPALDAKIEKNMELKVNKAHLITLNIGGKNQQIWSTSTTVADFLKEHNVKLNPMDKVKPGLTTVLNKNTNVEITRVEKVTDVVEEPIVFKIVQRTDKNLAEGTKKVIQEGEKGTRQKQFEVILENGKEISRKLIKTITTKESKDKIVVVGTKASSQPALASRGTGSKSKEFYVTATAYTASCNGCSGTTATGYNLRSNPNAKVIAVDPSVIPLGSKVYVEGYGYAVAADTGSAISGNKIDVFFPNKSQAYQWGRKKVKIRVLR